MPAAPPRRSRPLFPSPGAPRSLEGRRRVSGTGGCHCTGPCYCRAVSSSSDEDREAFCDRGACGIGEQLDGLGRRVGRIEVQDPQSIGGLEETDRGRDRAGEARGFDDLLDVCRQRDRRTGKRSRWARSPGRREASSVDASSCATAAISPGRISPRSSWVSLAMSTLTTISRSANGARHACSRSRRHWRPSGSMSADTTPTSTAHDISIPFRPGLRLRHDA